jgi:hypothetical protein
MEVITQRNMISVMICFRIVGILSIILAISTGLFSSLAYAKAGYDFSIFRTYLSDMGDTPGWPQILFNSGTLLTAPLRLFVVFLLAFTLFSHGTSISLCVLIVAFGFISTTGTILMTAVPYSINLGIHKTGIGLYFLGVVILQSLIGITEWRIKQIPRVLPILSWLMVVVYLVFVGFVGALEKGAVTRESPVIWEWMCYFVSIIWLASHTIAFGF